MAYRFLDIELLPDALFSCIMKAGTFLWNKREEKKNA